MKPDRVQYNTQIQPHNAPDEGVNLLSVYRSLLQIVAGLEEREYTEINLRQTEVNQHPNLANPASE